MTRFRVAYEASGLRGGFFHFAYATITMKYLTFGGVFRFES